MMGSVVHVISTAEVGGGGEHLVELVRGLLRRGFTNAVIVGRDGPTTERLRQAGASVTVMGPLGATAPLPLGGRFRALRPGLVHLHGSRAGLAGVIAARLTGVRPVVYTAHAFAFRRRLPQLLHWAAVRAEAVTCRLADRVIALNRGDVVAAAASGIPTTRFTVIANGIDLARFGETSGRREEFGLDARIPVVGMVARLVPQKDPLSFLRMAQLVSRTIPETRFLLVGDGPLRARVEQAMREMALDGRVILTGFRDDVPELLRTMDVVVLTSLWEGLPLTLLEAMAAARPIVATRVQGTADVVVDGDTGILVAPEDSAQLAAAVVELVRNPEQRQRMGGKGRARVAREFSVERMVTATVDVYRSVLLS
ncbi:MAG TPA: glycosyltransferase family 4 protein [bacterium]|nr:glycosyltransferase family 4 protein [bacterium]